MTDVADDFVVHIHRIPPPNVSIRWGAEAKNYYLNAVDVPNVEADASTPDNNQC